MSYAVTLEGVSKRFGDHAAVTDMSLAVPSGTVYGVLGPNGAGKSTTLRMILNIFSRDSGRIEVLGRDPLREPSILRQVGYLPEERGMYHRMRVREAVAFFGRLKGLGRGEANRRAGQWLERLELADWGEHKVEALSKGMQQKVQFIATAMHEPDLLILDEPFSGLDPVNQDVLQAIVRETRDAGRTVLFSTHVMDQAERVCDSVCIIAGGRKVLEGPVAELRRREAGERYRIEFEQQDEQIKQLMQPGPLFREVETQDYGWVVSAAEGVDRRALLNELNRQEHPLRRFDPVEPSLHEIFLRHARPSDRGDGIQEQEGKVQGGHSHG